MTWMREDGAFGGVSGSDGGQLLCWSMFDGADGTAGTCWVSDVMSREL